MIETTPELRVLPPDDTWTDDVCRKGQGPACCIYLTMAPGGWSCEKQTDFGPVLLSRRPRMSAQSDNCEGRGSRL